MNEINKTQADGENRGAVDGLRFVVLEDYEESDTNQVSALDADVSRHLLRPIDNAFSGQQLLIRASKNKGKAIANKVVE